MNLLAAIASFIKVVEAGSIVGAAKALGVSAAAVSQTLNRLETHLGVRLLQRTTRRMALTENGALYYEKVRRIAADLESAQSAIIGDEGELQGRLSIASTSAFGRHVLAPLLASFAALHPRLLVELSTTNGKINHIQNGIDLSLRIKPQLEDGIVARRIVSLPFIFCAAPAYLARAACRNHRRTCNTTPAWRSATRWMDVFCVGVSSVTASITTPRSTPPPSATTSTRWRKWQSTAQALRAWPNSSLRPISKVVNCCRCSTICKVRRRLMSNRWTFMHACRNERR